MSHIKIQNEDDFKNFFNKMRDKYIGDLEAFLENVLIATPGGYDADTVKSEAFRKLTLDLDSSANLVIKGAEIAVAVRLKELYNLELSKWQELGESNKTYLALKEKVEEWQNSRNYERLFLVKEPTKSFSSLFSVEMSSDEIQALFNAWLKMNADLDEIHTLIDSLNDELCQRQLELVEQINATKILALRPPQNNTSMQAVWSYIMFKGDSSASKGLDDTIFGYMIEHVDKINTVVDKVVPLKALSGGHIKASNITPFSQVKVFDGLNSKNINLLDLMDWLNSLKLTGEDALISKMLQYTAKLQHHVEEDAIKKAIGFATLGISSLLCKAYSLVVSSGEQARKLSEEIRTCCSQEDMTDVRKNLLLMYINGLCLVFNKQMYAVLPQSDNEYLVKLFEAANKDLS
ncbi:hypothetical protein [Thalassomonas actiniarum]|uniref:Uncharacterized protein n=1 Tax=Thalassomonas actiniarum TaxID=485447 RepID=A0AAE9YVC7_9GAMM|nr:hypothetical protein [Thalassomonas actiniarum]WDE01024.1 hypothetical protein SG35_010530 [Thalassomonas actiniarum]